MRGFAVHMKKTLVFSYALSAHFVGLSLCFKCTEIQIYSSIIESMHVEGTDIIIKHNSSYTPSEPFLWYTVLIAWNIS